MNLNDQKTVVEMYQPTICQWMDQFSNEKVKVRNQDSKGFTDLKYIVGEELDRNGDSKILRQDEFLNEFNQAIAGLRSNYDTQTLLNNEEGLKTKMDQLNSIFEANKPLRNVSPTPNIRTISTSHQPPSSPSPYQPSKPIPTPITAVSTI